MQIHVCHFYCQNGDEGSNVIGVEQPITHLRNNLCHRDLGVKNVRLRFGFWAHMLLSLVSVLQIMDI